LPTYLSLVVFTAPKRLTSVNQNNFLALLSFGFYRRHMQIALGSIGQRQNQRPSQRGRAGEEEGGQNLTGGCHFHNWPKNQQRTTQLLASSQTGRLTDKLTDGQTDRLRMCCQWPFGWRAVIKI